MLEHAVYSVISPEGCASILWRDPGQASVAAEALHLTAEDLLRLKLIDQIVPEPLGGAQRDKSSTLQSVSAAVQEALGSLSGMDGASLRAKRREKFLAMGHEAVG